MFMCGKNLSVFQDDVCIVLCGEAGQGIQTVESILTRILKLTGYHIFSTKEFMSRIRGGNNSTSIRVSSVPLSMFIGGFRLRQSCWVRGRYLGMNITMIRL